MWAGPRDDADVGIHFDHMAVAMSTESVGSSAEEDSLTLSSDESSLELSHESSSFDSGESGPEGVHPFLYEPVGSSDSEDGTTSSEDESPRLLNLNW